MYFCQRTYIVVTNNSIQSTFVTTPHANMANHDMDNKIHCVSSTP